MQPAIAVSQAPHYPDYKVGVSIIEVRDRLTLEFLTKELEAALHKKSTTIEISIGSGAGVSVAEKVGEIVRTFFGNHPESQITSIKFFCNEDTGVVRAIEQRTRYH